MDDSTRRCPVSLSLITSRLPWKSGFFVLPSSSFRAIEYVTLILSASEGEMQFETALGGRSYREVISIQKSVITEYKTGKLDLEAFKKKVLIYNN